MRYAVCTSFSPKGYKLYGKRFIESFLEHWPDHVHLMVKYEKDRPDIKHDRIAYRDLLDDRDHNQFCLNYRNAKTMSGDSKWGALKWCKKVFALSHDRIYADWWVWVDGDVETTAMVTDGYLAELLPDDKAIACLLRPDYRYSECGFVGYNMTRPEPPKLLKSMRDMYATGKVFGLEEWGDSFVFDHCRKSIINDEDVHDLAADARPEGLSIRDAIHPWPRSPLAATMQHSKGPRRKTEVYGGAC